MKRKTKASAKVDGAAALTELLARLPDGPVSDAVRLEVTRLRRLAIQERPRPTTERERLLQAIADAERDYLSARAEGSHQAADRCRRHRVELEKELAELDTPGPERAASELPDPDLERADWLRHHLREVEKDLDYLRRSEQWSQIPALDSRACALRDELDAVRDREVGDEPVTPDQLRAAILELPHELVPVAADALQERMNG